MSEFDAEYFHFLWDIYLSRRDPLPLRSTRCSECPAGCMYKQVNQDMKELPKETQIAHVCRTACHMTPRYACRGAAEEVGVVEEVKAAYDAFIKTPR